MATWHQQRNSAGMRGLYAPDAKVWKVISDRPNEMSSAITFRLKRDAERLARRNGGFVVAPTRYKPR